jgi:integrase
LPVVLSRDEVGKLLRALAGQERLVVMLLYGAGLRLEECLDLRVKDSISIASRSSCGRGRGKGIA